MCDENDLINPADIQEDEENNLFLRLSSSTNQILTANGNLINRVLKDPIFVTEDQLDLIRQFIELYSSLVIDYDILDSESYQIQSILDEDNLFKKNQSISQISTLFCIRAQSREVKFNPTSVILSYKPKGVTFRGVYKTDYHMIPDNFFDERFFFDYFPLLLTPEYYQPMVLWMCNSIKIWESHF